jgi:hypothetical protein
VFNTQFRFSGAPDFVGIDLGQKMKQWHQHV